MSTRVICAAALLAAGSALANPTGPTVVAGSATVTSSGNTLTVTNSSGAVINWQGFSIGAGETTNFQQPSSASTVLNRVTGAGASDIHGALTSNGKVFLVNPNGVLFGPGAQVNVGGLVATSLNITDADFLAGNYRFVNGGNAGPVTSRGTIVTAPGGSIALFAPVMTLGGSISAGSNLTLAVANQVTIAPSGTLTFIEGSGLMTIETGLILNTEPGGLITIAGGGALPPEAALELDPFVIVPTIPEVSPIVAGGGSITLSSAAGSNVSTAGLSGSLSMNSSVAVPAGTIQIMTAAEPVAATITAVSTQAPAASVSLNLLKREVSF
jgi:filamentous hemagglutinin family protein